MPSNPLGVIYLPPGCERTWEGCISGSLGDLLSALTFYKASNGRWGCQVVMVRMWVSMCKVCLYTGTQPGPLRNGWPFSLPAYPTYRDSKRAELIGPTLLPVLVGGAYIIAYVERLVKSHLTARGIYDIVLPWVARNCLKRSSGAKAVRPLAIPGKLTLDKSLLLWYHISNPVRRRWPANMRKPISHCLNVRVVAQQ